LITRPRKQRKQVETEDFTSDSEPDAGELPDDDDDYDDKY
jgi:hypothetical protein